MHISLLQESAPHTLAEQVREKALAGSYYSFGSLHNGLGDGHHHRFRVICNINYWNLCILSEDDRRCTSMCEHYYWIHFSDISCMSYFVAIYSTYTTGAHGLYCGVFAWITLVIDGDPLPERHRSMVGANSRQDTASCVLLKHRWGWPGHRWLIATVDQQLSDAGHLTAAVTQGNDITSSDY